MSEIFINKLKTCAVSGHRKIEKIDLLKLEEVFFNVIRERKINTFLIGMAVGFDTICFRILEKIRKTENIRIVACIPCLNQDRNFSEKQKKEYKEILEKVDEKILISENYTPYCMSKRNKFMVDNCSFLVYYLKENKGGTKNTVEYAKKQQIEHINIYKI